jgi:trigger factor
MPNITNETLPKNQLKLTFTVTVLEAKPYLEEAAKRISTQSPIDGFRPGHAPYDVVKTRAGEMKIFEEALESIVRSSFIKAVLAQNIETVGSPHIEVTKLAPDNDIVFSTTVTLMPAVKELADARKLSVPAREVKAEDREISLALRDLQRMRTAEVRAPQGETVNEKDKVVVSMNMKLESVPVEGGQSPNHAIYLNEDYYIPGLKAQLIGMKEGETRSFTLPFPKSHVQKMLAGKDVEFEVGLKELYHLQEPEIDDAFASGFGAKDLETLKGLLKQNILTEKTHEAKAREEKEMLELLANKSQIEDIPDLLLNEEINKMIGELKHGVEEQGAVFDDYVKNLGKTLAALKLDFTPQALLRVKVALVMRAAAKQEGIEVNEKEIDEEVDRLAGQYEEKEIKDRVYSPESREYIAQMLKNRKVIDFLRLTMVK